LKLAVAWAAVALSAAVGAQAQETVDQENLPSGTVLYVSCGVGPGSISQGFTPALPALTAVEIMLAPSVPAATRTVRVRSGAVDGPIIGEASAANQAGWTRYQFSAAVPVVPGQLYVIEWVYSTPVVTIAENASDTYAGGHAYGCTNNSNTGIDMVFRTYGVTSLPTRPVTWGGVKSRYMD
jgi:hypothetical protein